MDIPFSTLTIVLGHATFCIVIVYNNAVARFRRLSGGVMEASADLGANAFQTFRYILLPNLGTALLAGGMLAFALSFDEVIVTTFTAGQQSTLPIWMLEELVRPRQRPVTNVVAMVVFIATFFPILAAYYLTRGGSETAGGGKTIVEKIDEHRQAKRVNMAIGIWYNEESGHIHIQSSDFGGFISTVNRNPESVRGNPNLYNKLACCLKEAGAPTQY